MNVKKLVLGSEPDQVLRIRRLFLAIMTYGAVVLFTAYAISRGLLWNLHPVQLLAGSIGPNLVFYALIRSGWNLRFHDPSLTLPQMLVGTLASMYVVAHAHEARGAFLMLYLLILVMGIFHLRPRQFLAIGAVAPVLYAMLIGYQVRTDGDAFNPGVDILQCLALILITPWFAVVGGYISNARRRLMHSNTELAKVVHDLEDAMKTIQLQATHDELTGLFNRRYVMEALRSEQARSERTHEGFCILLFDLDHFKRVNDTYGHLAGDRVLQNFAKTVGGRLRAMDRLGRYGGEEFLLLMPRMSLSNALIGAERLRRSVEQAVFSEAGADIRITVSIGVAPYREGESIERLIGNADRALYLAKSSGRNCVKAGSMAGLDTTVTALQQLGDDPTPARGQA